ncbi:MAG: hypothetical protein MUC96_28170 [Myxococcaceae bacterium]|jgi:hypothetical protein|nr:hypothetical protein [Myxococcaceae bacterium]
MPTPVFESDCVVVSYEPEIQTIHYSWKRFAKGAEFKEALEQGLEGAQKFKATGWIGDVQQLGVVDEADTQWVNTDWFPRLLSGSSISFMAVIVGPRAITKMSVGAIMSKVAGKLTNKYLGTVEEAREWIAAEQRMKKSA